MNTPENMNHDQGVKKTAGQEMWDREYATSEYAYGKTPNDFLAERQDAIPKGKVLCLADGEGRNSVFLAQQGFEVTAVDISPVGIEKARKLAKERGVEVALVCADLSDFDLGESRWDGIVSIFCHLPPTIRADLHQRVMRALKPEGVYLIEAYTPEQLSYGTGGPPVAAMMMNKESLVNELPALRFEHLVELDREVIEGRNHSGMAAVVQGIGRR